MSLFPLPAILFLCFLVVLLIVLAIVYFTVLKKNLCCPTVEHGDVEEGEEVAETVDGPKTRHGDTAPSETSASAVPTDGTDGTTDGGNEGGGGDPPARVVDGAPAPSTKSPANATLPGTPSDTMTLAPPAPSEAGGAGDSASTVGDLVGATEAGDEEPLCIAGKLLIQFTYMPAANKINLSIIRASDIPPPERGGAENIQVHLCILPMRKQRCRTKAVPAVKGVFNTTFQFIHMTQDLVEKCAIRLRVYGTQKFSKRLIGEVKVSLSKVDLTSALADEQIWKDLSPKGFVAYYYGIDEEDEPDIDD